MFRWCLSTTVTIQCGSSHRQTSRSIQRSTLHYLKYYYYYRYCPFNNIIHNFCIFSCSLRLLDQMLHYSNLSYQKKDKNDSNTLANLIPVGFYRYTSQSNQLIKAIKKKLKQLFIVFLNLCEIIIPIYRWSWIQQFNWPEDWWGSRRLKSNY